MSKDSQTQSRIRRPDVFGSRIPVPGSFRIPPPSASRLPAKRNGPLHPPSTPIGFLRPPASQGHRPGAGSAIARSYSGEKLSSAAHGDRILSFPSLIASTPAPTQLRQLGGLSALTPATPQTSSALPFLKKLELGTTERLEDIKLCRREFAIPSDDDEDDLGEDGGEKDATVQMLVDESLELVGAHSTDNLLDPPVGSTTPLPDPPAANTTVVLNVGKEAISTPAYPVRNEPTVTLQRDGNVTYEFRRSGTFVKSSSRDSLDSPLLESSTMAMPHPSRPRPPVLDHTHTRTGATELVLGLTRTFRRESSTESVDSPAALFDLTRTLSFRRPSTGEMLLEDVVEEVGPAGVRRCRRPPVLNSTMVNDERLINATQSIPNITQELLYACDDEDLRLSRPAPSDSALNRTHLVEVQRGKGKGQTKTTRLTFNLEESLVQFSGAAPAVDCAGPLNQTQVFSSTLHTDSMVIAGGGSVGSQKQNSTMLLMDQDMTLVPGTEETGAPDLGDESGEESEEQRSYAAERRRFNAAVLDQREPSVEADVSGGKEIFDLSLEEPEPTSNREEVEEGERENVVEDAEEDEEEVVIRRKLETRPNSIPSKQRFSFGLDLTECTLDCSIELCDSSLSLTRPGGGLAKSPTTSLSHVGSLTKQGSFEMDESLGILTPDQMKEFLDSTTTNTNNTNNASNANAAAAGLELQLVGSNNSGMGGGGHHHKHGALQHHCRIDQTPSPEELPLDPVGVKTDMTDILLPAELLLMSQGAAGPQGYVGLAGVVGAGGGSTNGGTGNGGATISGISEVSQADSDPKTDQMSKSATSSKVSNSFITSITSITSLDTGYQGDGEMSRPASRGADHSPSNGPRLKSAHGGGGAWQPMMAAAVAAVPRRQDPMTDSDFFTESDADDVFNRGDARRAQIIDGQLYGGGAAGCGGPLGAGAGDGQGGARNALFHAIDEQEAQHRDGQNEDSCMESSGIFTDVENRADDDLVQRRAEDRQEAAGSAEPSQHADDMSPDTSTDTISSSNSQNFVRPPCSPGNVHPEEQSADETIRPATSNDGGASRRVSASANDDDARSSSGGLIATGIESRESPPGDGERDHHYQAEATSSVPSAAADDGNIGVTGPTTTVAPAAVGGAGSSSGSVVLAGSEVVRCDASGPASGSSAQSPGSGGTKPTCMITGNAGLGPAGRRQLKNDANRTHARKHVVPGLSSTRVERLSKVRLASKDSPESPRGSASSVVTENGDGVSGRGCPVLYGASGGDYCDQENKRPGGASVMGTRHTAGARGVGSSAGGQSNLSFVKKSATPNKWDAVMNKIAENKAVMKRNFSDVKSRISCGGGAASLGGRSSSVSVSRRDSPATSLKSPPSECTSVVSRASTHAKQRSTTIAGTGKRGRTHSKDSEQSSLSDLSLSGGSPKLTLKVSSSRPAKKRDVRTINSSSSDLGPPSKTNGAQPARSSAARAAAALQKRISPNLTNSSSPLVPEQLKASPPSKRNLLLKRNGTATKTPLKGKLAAHILKEKDVNKENTISGGDHNRLVGATPNAKSSTIGSGPTAIGTTTTNSPKPSAKSLLRPSTGSSAASTPTSATANHHHPPQQQQQHAGSNGVSNGLPSTNSMTAVKAIQRNGTIILDKTAGSPLLICEATEEPSPKTPPTPASSATGRDGSAVTSERRTESNCYDPRRHPTMTAGGRLRDSTGEKTAKPSIAAVAGPELVDVSLLNHAQKGVEALGVLVQYLVFNLDAFSCPTIKMAHQKTTSELLEAKSMLDGERTHSQTLKQQLLETAERETELQQLHRCELSRVETCLSEQQRSADERIASLEAQLQEKESHSRELMSRIDGYEAKLVEHAKQLESSRARELDLLQRINALSCTENELRDKVHSSELAFSERLQAAAMRERDLTDQIGGLTRDLERMRRETERKEQELEEKLTITKDECVVLRQTRNSSVEPPTSATSQCNGLLSSSSSSSSMVPLQLNRSSGNINQLQVLQDEVDSLRCVLDLKQHEISELRKQTQQYERDAKDLPAALVKISALESRIEDLQVQLKTKTEEEKELQQKLKQLQDNLSQETKIKSRLSLHNEELQWRLKQNSEKFTLAYAELSKSYHENSSYMLNATKTSLDQTTPVHHSHHHQLSHNQSRSSCSERFFDMDDISPPTSPVIKGMVEKSDSVSWVLEIDDEPPEVSASRMVRRAGSFRSNTTYDSVAKRPKCGLNQTLNGGGIQQSASAASILKQHSSDMSPIKPPTHGAGGAGGSGMSSSGSGSHHRLRSKSVSIKAAEPPKKIVRSNSGAASASPCPPPSASKPIRMTEMAGSWKEQPLYSSSPYAHKRFLAEPDAIELVASSGNAIDQQQQQQQQLPSAAHRAKDLFLEETEFLSEPESPFARRPKLSNGEDIANPPVEVFHRDKAPNFKKSKENRGLITCDTTALTTGSCSKAGGAGGSGERNGAVNGVLTAREKRREFTRKGNNLGGSLLLEAAGEALVSGSNSDDEASLSSSASSSSSSSSASSSGGSSSCISERSLSSNSRESSSRGNSPLHATGKRNSDRMNADDDDEEAVEGGAAGAVDSSKVQSHHHHHHRHHHHHHHRRRHSNISLEDALMQKIVASLNGDGAAGVGGSADTPMEVSWSEDGDPGSESIV